MNLRLSGKRYPLALSLRGKRCLIVGFGSVGRRKLTRLLGLGESGPCEILVFDPLLQNPRDDELLQKPGVIFQAKSVSASDLTVHLVFACTGSREENARIAGMCADRGILCNCASEPWLGDVSLPALVECPPLTVALSTEGASPAFAKKWRKELELWAKKKQPVLKLMAALRPLILALGNPQAENKKLFSALAEGPLEEMLAAAEWQKALDYLTATLPETLQPHLAPLFLSLSQAENTQI